MNALFLGTEEDADYQYLLKGMFKGVTTFTSRRPFEYLIELEQYCEHPERNITKIATTNINILRSLLTKMGNPRSEPKLSEYAGSFFQYKNLEIVIIDPLKQLQTVPYGKFVTSRYISKLVAPQEWREATEFKWKVLDEKNILEFYSLCQTAFAMAIDIETVKEPLIAIRCTSFTLLHIDGAGHFSTTTGVLPANSSFALYWHRKIVEVPCIKVFQNGKYDNIYFIRHGILPVNWIGDTAHFMHAWYAELPKDLGFLNAFFLRKVVYWKDLAETSDLFEYYRYNAMDGWATINVFISQLLESPDWAKRNYVEEFPLVFPCLLSELTGVPRDAERHIEERTKVVQQEDKILTSLRKEIGSKNFNPGSHIQVKQLMRVLGIKEPKSSDEDALKAAMYAHPLNNRILGKIIEIRGLRKLRTTYLRTDDDITATSKRGHKEFKGYILYSLNPHGTDTGRLASRESAFWCGLQIQNIPTGKEVKRTIKAPEGFNIAECDLEQAESRDVAFLSGDIKLIEAVTGTRDFHSVNASAFFGIPYVDLYDDERKETKNKPLRNTSKRTNHGANYNMGPAVLADTMGLKEVWDTKRLLKLPFYDPFDITEYLLVRFHQTYPTLKGHTRIKSLEVLNYVGVPQSEYKLYAPGSYYAHIANAIDINRMYTSPVYHHVGVSQEFASTDPVEIEKARCRIEVGHWTRYCFGDPVNNKLHLNSYSAHPSQSLNAMTLNKAFMRIFYEIALPEAEDFRLHAQIHDSTFFSWRENRTDLPAKVQKCMEIPVTAKDIKGIYRTFTVPAALKLGKAIRTEQGKAVIDDYGNEVIKYAKYWSDTE